MKTRINAAMTAVMLAISMASSVHADVVHSNFGPGDTFADSSLPILGSPSLYYAMPFVPNGTFSLDSIELSFWMDLPGPGDVEVVLFANDGGVPGALLESLGVINVVLGGSDIYSASSVVHTQLCNGQTYFVGVGPASPGTDVFLNENVIGEKGRCARENGFPWSCGGNGITPVFRVNGSPVSTPCQSDLICDGVVNIFDLLAMLAAWGPNPGHAADLNGDGTVNVFDLLAMLAAWGACP